MGITVDLVDKTFNPRNYPGVTDFDLIRVKITPAFTGKINLAAGFQFADFSGHIGRLELDSVMGDALHVGNLCHDLVVEEGVVYVHDLAPTQLHWDAIQVMGGYRITFRNLVVIQRNPNYDTEGRCIFMNAGIQPPDIEDVVFERCYFESHRDPISTKARVVTQQGSLRSGFKDCYFVEAQAGVSPLWQRSGALEPVNSGNVIIPVTQPVPLHP